MKTRVGILEKSGFDRIAVLAFSPFPDTHEGSSLAFLYDGLPAGGYIRTHHHR